MSDGSAIEWTDATWNPVRGCVKVSPGCKHCYAETFAERWRGIKGHPFEQGFDLRLVPEALDKPLRWKKARRIFVNSMSDLFHEDVSNEYIAAVFGVMAARPVHDFQVLTKRAERMRDWFKWIGERGGVCKFIRANPGVLRDWFASGSRFGTYRGQRIRTSEDAWAIVFNAAACSSWPLPNVWLGVSVENQEYADERIPALLATPAAVRFLSVEPLLGPVDLHAVQIPGERDGLRFSALTRQHEDRYGSSDTTLDWIIVGGESGPGAREMKPEWVRRIRDDVTDAGAALFFKQWGGVRKKLAGRELDGRTWDEFPVVQP
jgi:protein gp37